MHVGGVSSLELGTDSGLFAISSSLPSKVNLLSWHPQEQGLTASSNIPATCGLLCTGLDTQWGMGEAPTSARYDLWLRVEPAATFRAGPGGQGATWRRPKDRILLRLFSCGPALAQNHAVWDPAW